MLKPEEKTAIKELRAFAEALVKTNMLELRESLKAPQVVMVNILTGNDVEYGQISDEAREYAKSQQMQNMMSSIRNKTEKAVRDVALYEQLIRISDNLITGKYQSSNEIVPVDQSEVVVSGTEVVE